MTQQVQNALIADGSITTAKFDAGAVCPNATNATNVTGTGVITSANILDGTVTKTDLANPLTQGTALAYNWNGLTTNTYLDFAGIPSWVKRITLALNGVSTSGTSIPQVQLGSTTFATSGYTSNVSSINGGTGGSTNQSTGYGLNNSGSASATAALSGAVTITNVSGNIWVASFSLSVGASITSFGGGVVTLAGVLDRVRLTTVNGTDTFDAGSVNIIYE